jgi:hypothetical protein
LDNKFIDLGGIDGAKELVKTMSLSDDFFTGLGDQLVELDIENQL